VRFLVRHLGVWIFAISTSVLLGCSNETRGLPSAAGEAVRGLTPSISSCIKREGNPEYVNISDADSKDDLRFQDNGQSSTFTFVDDYAFCSTPKAKKGKSLTFKFIGKAAKELHGATDYIQINTLGYTINGHASNYDNGYGFYFGKGPTSLNWPAASNDYVAKGPGMSCQIDIDYMYMHRSEAASDHRLGAAIRSVKC
jgi:hypothetical protein